MAEWMNSIGEKYKRKEIDWDFIHNHIGHLPNFETFKNFATDRNIYVELDAPEGVPIKDHILVVLPERGNGYYIFDFSGKQKPNLQTSIDNLMTCIHNSSCSFPGIVEKDFYFLRQPPKRKLRRIAESKSPRLASRSPSIVPRTPLGSPRSSASRSASRVSRSASRSASRSVSRSSSIVPRTPLGSASRVSGSPLGTPRFPLRALRAASRSPPKSPKSPLRAQRGAALGSPLGSPRSPLKIQESSPTPVRSSRIKSKSKSKPETPIRLKKTPKQSRLAASLPRIGSPFTEISDRKESRSRSPTSSRRIREAHKTQTTSSLSQSDINLLLPKQWLNDNIINLYFTFIQKQSPKKTMVLSSHWFKKLENGYNYDSVRKWSLRTGLRILDVHYVLIPINITNKHWCLAVINVKDKTFEFHDPFGGSKNLPRNLFQIMQNYLQDEVKNYGTQQESLNLTEWMTIINKKTYPKQQNNYDCGVFICLYADYISNNRSFCIPIAMDVYRNHMKIVIARNSAEDPFVTDYQSYAYELLFDNEDTIYKNDIGPYYETNLGYSILVSSEPKAMLMLTCLYELSNLKLAPEYYANRNGKDIFIKVKMYKENENTLLYHLVHAKKNYSQYLMAKLDEAIKLCHTHDMIQFGLKFSDIYLIDDAKKMIFTNLEGFRMHPEGVSISSQWAGFVRNLYVSGEMKQLEHNEVVLNFLLSKGDKEQQNTIEHILNGQFDYSRKQKDDLIIKKLVFKYSVDEFIQEERVRLVCGFIKAQFGEHAFHLLPMEQNKIKTIKRLNPPRTLYNKPWVYLINDMFILKLSCTDNPVSTSRAKYEILMHQKYLAAGGEKMAPGLLSYDAWKHPTKNTIGVGFVSKKIETVHELLNQKQPQTVIEDLFKGMILCLQKMCKAGLWHFDSHFHNWGYTLNADGTKHILLFDFEYASTGTFQLAKVTSQSNMIRHMNKDKNIIMFVGNNEDETEYFNQDNVFKTKHKNLSSFKFPEKEGGTLVSFKPHDTRVCNWNHEIGLLAYSLKTFYLKNPNLKELISGLIGMHTKLYLQMQRIQRGSMMAPQQDLAQYNTDSSPLLDQRIQPEEAHWYVTFFGPNEWKPVVIRS